MTATFFLAMIGWVIFRSESLGQAVGFFQKMFSTSIINVGGLDCLCPLYLCLIMLVVEWLQRDKQHALDLSTIKRAWVRYLIYTWVFYAIYCFVPNQMSEFIYFQF